jgi:hypothetical protein
MKGEGFLQDREASTVWQSGWQSRLQLTQWSMARIQAVEVFGRRWKNSVCGRKVALPVNLGHEV